MQKSCSLHDLARTRGADQHAEVFVLKNGTLSLWRTVLGNRRFLFRRRKLAQPLIDRMKQWQPVSTDRLRLRTPRCGRSPKPSVFRTWLSTAFEFFLSSPLPKGTSLAHRVRVKGGGWIVEVLAKADLRIVGKILVEKRPKSTATFVGAILRKELESLTWEPQGEHFVVYSCPMLQASLAGINQLAERERKRGKVFGVERAMVDGYDWLDHQPTSESGFLEAVCQADFAVATPGNQFMAETLLLGIPVLMTPTPKQFEQEINAKMQLMARPDQYAMFHPDASIFEPSTNHDQGADTSGRARTVELIEALHQGRSTPA